MIKSMTCWGLRTRHGLVWDTHREPDRAMRPALFQTKKAAKAFQESLGYFYSQAEIVRIRVKFSEV